MQDMHFALPTLQHAIHAQSCVDHMLRRLQPLLLRGTGMPKNPRASTLARCCMHTLHTELCFQAHRTRLHFLLSVVVDILTLEALPVVHCNTLKVQNPPVKQTAPVTPRLNSHVAGRTCSPHTQRPIGCCCCSPLVSSLPASDDRRPRRPAVTHGAAPIDTTLPAPPAALLLYPPMTIALHAICPQTMHGHTHKH